MGLLAHGMAMFQMASLIPAFFWPIWDPTHVELLTHESFLGQFLIAFFSWNPEPDLLELGCWVGHVTVVGYLFLRPAQPSRASRAAQPSN